MKINGNEIRPGMIIIYEGKLCKVLAMQHVKPGKGGAYAQTELKDIIVGTKFNPRFRSDEAVERAILEQKKCIFSYKDKDMYIFMDKDNFEQITLSEKEVPDAQKPYIVDGLELTIDFYEDKPIGLTLPSSVILTIEETEFAIKGQTISGSFKPAILTNGMRIMIPPHLDSGTRIVVNTETNEYVERAKE